MHDFDVLIVGAGHGGSQTAIALRQAGFQGSIGMIGEEPDLPYERPPLSKEYLAQEQTFDRILIRPAAFWEDHSISVILGRRVAKVASESKLVRVEDGTAFGYGILVWAAGGTPRRLTCDGHSAIGVHTVRTRADVDRMIDEMPNVTQTVVIGGGYIGLEAAAVLAKFGKQVTLLEALDRVLARVTGEPLSRFYEAEHRAQGVDLRLGARVDCILEEGGRVTGVRLDSGETLPAQMVIVGIGIEPAVGPLLEAGAVGRNGVSVDRQCQTSLPDIYAVGDCALHANDFADGVELRVESVQNANDQAGVVAKTIMGIPAEYNMTPWFWSNQYDLRLQTIGLLVGYDSSIVRGDPATRSFSVVYLKSGSVIALDCVNSTKDYVHGRALVLDRLVVEKELIADARIPLKEVASHAKSVGVLGGALSEQRGNSG